MDSKKAASLISDNMRAVYGYAFGRLFDKDDVDDLVSEIIVNALSSIGQLRNEQAYWGWFWKIAETTFTGFIKKRSRENNVGEIPENAGTVLSAEEQFLEDHEKSEQIYALRRELSLLSEAHRKVTVAYYMQGKSCSEIASEEGISVEMVKYHLFKTRRLLKEGIGMERKIGEKAYNPGVLHLDFWGDRNFYSKDPRLNRKLPGAILLAAYYAPMTDSELSLELGVSMPYLEEELDYLVKAGLLLLRGGKYSTNIVILTEEFEREFAQKTKRLYEDAAKSVCQKAEALLPVVRALPFRGNDYTDNRLITSLLNIGFVNAFLRANEECAIGEFKPLPLGGNGFVWGIDNDYRYHHFSSVSIRAGDDKGRSWISTENYNVFDACCHWSHDHWSENVRLTNAAVNGDLVPCVSKSVFDYAVSEGYVTVNDGALEANFPVFDEHTYNEVEQLLQPITDEVCRLMLDISDIAALVLAEHAPAPVRDQCGAIARIGNRLDVAAILFETLVEKKLLSVPKEKTPLTMWGVICR